MYKDEIIVFSGGINEWVGELDQAPHKNGKNWYRIKRPCRLISERMPDKGIRQKLLALQGHGNFYKRYVDIRIPEESIVEILTLDKSGEIYKAYEKESTREPSKIILHPAMSDLKLN